MRTHDLAPLIGQATEPTVDFRQGVVVEWDETTGTNTVDVNGALLADLPALNIGDFVHLEPGDVVGLLRVKSTYFILGRVILPRAVDRNRATLDFESNAVQTSGFALSTSPVAKTSITLHPPDWVDEAAVVCAQNCGGINSTATQDFIECHPQVNGALQIGMEGGAGAGGAGFASVMSTTVISGPFNGSILCEAMVLSRLAAWSANASNFTNLNVFALYRRID